MFAWHTARTFRSRKTCDAENLQSTSSSSFKGTLRMIYFLLYLKLWSWLLSLNRNLLYSYFLRWGLVSILSAHFVFHIPPSSPSLFLSSFTIQGWAIWKTFRQLYRIERVSCKLGLCRIHHSLHYCYNWMCWFGCYRQMTWSFAEEFSCFWHISFHYQSDLVPFCKVYLYFRFKFHFLKHRATWCIW